MRVLAVTKIFPNQLEPLSAPFNRQQFRELARLCGLTVLAAAPYVPFARLTGMPPRAAKLSALPRSEMIDGIETFHMRQLYVPRVGLAAAVPLYLASLVPYRHLGRASDVVLGSWAYPDGCAAVAFGRRLGKKTVVKVHGTDVNEVLERRSVRPIASRILRRADALIAVSRALKDALVRLGVADEKIHLVANGVD